MCIDKTGLCLFCKRNYSNELFFVGDECKNEDCQSHTDLVAVLRNGNDICLFCVDFNGEDYQAVFPESLSNWGINFTTHSDCKAYLVIMVYCLNLWSDFGSVSIDVNECTESDWHIFSKGTAKHSICHWFESSFKVSLTKDLMYHTMCDLRVAVNPTYKVLFDDTYYASGQELEKIVGPEFFSEQNGYEMSAYNLVINLPFVGSTLLDNGYQSVIRLS